MTVWKKKIIQRVYKLCYLKIRTDQGIRKQKQRCFFCFYMKKSKHRLLTWFSCLNSSARSEYAPEIRLVLLKERLVLLGFNTSRSSWRTEDALWSAEMGVIRPKSHLEFPAAVTQSSYDKSELPGIDLRQSDFTFPPADYQQHSLKASFQGLVISLGVSWYWRSTFVNFCNFHYMN